MRNRGRTLAITIGLIGLLVTAAYAVEKHNDRQIFMGTVTFNSTVTTGSGGVTLENSETITNGTNSAITFGRNDAGTVTINAKDNDATAALTVDTGGAAALTLGSAATSVSICNSAACDTITIGSNADADTITIGDSTDTAVSITDDNWSISTAGAAALASVDAATATSLGVGNTTATALSLCNSAACDTITIGSNADADTITIGDATDTTVSITDDNWSITAAGIASFASVRVVNGTPLTAANPTPNKATMQAASFFAVDTSSNAVDVDLPAMDSGDIGSEKKFAVTTGHATQALTVTSGTLTVTTHNTLGTTCEDAQDHIDCLITTTTTASCDTFCAD